MSHIDEGRIAAYLDGELPAGSGELVEIELHVEACAECRKLLEESLRQRNRARSILRSGTPSTTEAPQFEEILRRAGKGGNARGVAHQRSRLASLAWAATIVLAVGAGWYVTQDRGRGPIANAIRKLRPPTQAPSEPTMVLAEKNAAEPAADARREEASPAATPTAPPLAAQAPAGARADEAVPAVTPAPANQPPPALALQERPKALDTGSPEKTAGPPAAAQALASGAGRDRDSAALDRMAKSSLAADAGAVAGQVAAEQKKAESVAAAKDAQVALRGRAAAAAPTAAAPVPAAAPAPPAWRETSQGGAMRQLGRLPLQVPDLPVLAYYVRPSGSSEVRVTHDLGGGQVLEVIQEKIGADSSATLERQNEAGFAGNQVAQESDGFKTTLRGPLSRDSLAVLLQKLR